MMILDQCCITSNFEFNSNNEGFDEFNKFLTKNDRTDGVALGIEESLLLEKHDLLFLDKKTDKIIITLVVKKDAMDNAFK